MYSRKCVFRLGFFLTAFVMILLFQGCSLKQTLEIDKTAAGTVTFELTLASYFTEVAEQLSELMPMDSESSNNKNGFFDLGKITKDFEDDKNVVLQSLESPSGEILKGRLSFNDVTSVFNGDISSEGEGIFRFSQIGDVHTLSLELSYATIGRLLLSNPSMNSPLMENFGPLANKGLTDSDYLDMMQFALGDESRTGIKESFLLLDVNVDGKVVSQKGGEQLDEDTVRYRIPLLRILILDEQQSFSVSFTE